MVSAPQQYPSERLLIESAGLVISDEALCQLAASGAKMIANAESGADGPRCAWDSSGLTLLKGRRVGGSSAALLIDIGGTHTKVATVGEDGRFNLLFDELNDSFRAERSSSVPVLRAFLERLVCRIVEAAPTLLHAATSLRVGVIWSNQIEVQPLRSSHLKGITARMQGLRTGGYGKGEWFLDGLSDGHDIGRDIISSLTAAKLAVELLIIGNDTIFTLFTHPGAHAGVVISSGANCTVVSAAKGQSATIYNSELGGMLLVPESLRSDGDTLFAKRRGTPTVAIEELCAGAFFTELCISQIESLAKCAPSSAFADLQTALSSGAVALSNSVLSALLREGAAVPPELNELSPAAQSALATLTQALIRRAGAFAAVLVYLSVSNQIRLGESSLHVALDSSMARYFCGFFDSLQTHLGRLVPTGVECSVHLIPPAQLTPGVEIPVPMIGLARALREYPGS